MVAIRKEALVGTRKIKGKKKITSYYRKNNHVEKGNRRG